MRFTVVEEPPVGSRSNARLIIGRYDTLDEAGEALRRVRHPFTRRVLNEAGQTVMFYQPGSLGRDTGAKS